MLVVPSRHPEDEAALLKKISSSGARSTLDGVVVGYVIGCSSISDFVLRYPSYVENILRRDSIIPLPSALSPSSSLPYPTDLIETGKERNPLTMVEEEEEEPWFLQGRSEVNPAALRQQARDPRRLLLINREELVARYPATMHIDILPPWQGQGWGRKLIEKFVTAVRKEILSADIRSSKEMKLNTKIQSKDLGGIHIGISGENEKVVPFYEKLGFQYIEGLEPSGTIWMAREL